MTLLKERIKNLEDMISKFYNELQELKNQTEDEEKKDHKPSNKLFVRRRAT